MGRWRPLRLPLDPLRGCLVGREAEVDEEEDVVDCGETLPAEVGDCSGPLRGQSPRGWGATSGCRTVGRLDLRVAGYREAGSAEGKGT